MCLWYTNRGSVLLGVKRLHARSGLVTADKPGPLARGTLGRFDPFGKSPGDLST